MGCHTWVYKRDYRFVGKTSKELKNELLNRLKKTRELCVKELVKQTKNYDFDDTFIIEHISYLTRYINIIEKYEWKRETLIKHIIKKRHCDEPLFIYNIKEDKLYSNWNKYCDFFRYHNYNFGCFLKTPKEVIDHVFALHNNCCFELEDSDGEWAHYDACLAENNVIDAFKQKVYNMFEEGDNDILIAFG